jgi:hypothetical protein
MEEKLLIVIFSDETKGVPDGQRIAALNKFMKVTGLDREALVKRYTNSAGSEKSSSSSSGSMEDLVRIPHLEATIRGLQDQLQNERKHHDQRMETWFKILDKESDRLRQFAELARSLATAMLGAKWLDPKSLQQEIADFESMPTHKIIEERRLIEGPVKEAVAKANEADRPATREAINCVNCGRPFLPARSDAKTCSNTCRQALHRSRSHNGSNGSGQAVSGADTHARR